MKLLSLRMIPGLTGQLICPNCALWVAFLKCVYPLIEETPTKILPLGEGFIFLNHPPEGALVKQSSLI